jgi:TatD DNase family protein
VDDDQQLTGANGAEKSRLRRVFGAGRRRRPGADPDAASREGAPTSTRELLSAIWTDSHCHLQDDPDPGATLALAREVRVGRVICVGTDAESSQRAVVLAGAQSGTHEPEAEERGTDRIDGGEAAGPLAVPGGAAAEIGSGLPATTSTSSSRADIWATVGLHPHDAKNGLEAVAELLDKVATGEGLGPSRVVAVGECGLDYHYDHSPRNAQRTVFAAQVALAKRYDLALVIHTRDAWEDTFSILEVEGMPDRTVFHCFSGGLEEARRGLEMGAHLSFSGIVTFASATALREAATYCPLDRLLVETDSPFLTPVPYRGRNNQPAYLPLVGVAIAEAKGLDPETVAEASSANAAAVFRLGA